MKKISVLLAIITLEISSAGISSAETATAPKKNVPTPRMFGVTIDNIANLARIKASLAGLTVRPTTRIVFDEGMGPSYYKKAVTSIHTVSDIMGEIADSSSMKSYTVSAYAQRTSDYVNMLGSAIDIWEVGNEINGDWLGDNVSNKIFAANKIVKDRNLKSEITLYYNAPCGAPMPNEMFTWVSNNIPISQRSQFDYVLVSFYEDDCGGIQPNWREVFKKLAVEFPTSKIGFGECGTKFLARKERYLNRYYRTRFDDIPQFIGGYFWWYFYQDMVPKTKRLWGTLKTLSNEF